jgi:hypothetical protein
MTRRTLGRSETGVRFLGLMRKFCKPMSENLGMGVFSVRGEEMFLVGIFEKNPGGRRDEGGMRLNKCVRVGAGR